MPDLVRGFRKHREDDHAWAATEEACRFTANTHPARVGVWRSWQPARRKVTQLSRRPLRRW